MNLKNDKNYTYRNIWKIALPIIIGSAAQDLLLLADTAFIGRLGPVPLGAVAIGGLFYLAFVMAGWGFGIGIQVIIARRFGEGKTRQIERILQHSFLIMFLFAMLFLLSGLLTSKYLLPGFISSPDIAIQSQTFIDTRVWGFFAAMSNVVFRAYFVGTADTKIISISTLIMALTNCILDYFLIFGIWIFPQMGIKGSALASVIAEHLGTTVFLIYFLSKHPSKVFKHNMQFSPKIFKNIFRVSTPMLFQSALSFITWFIFFVFVEKMGEIPLAVSNIVRSIYIFMLMPIMGLASAANSLTSFAIGRLQPQAVKIIAQRAILLGWTGVFILVVPLIIFTRQVIEIYTHSNILIESTIPTMKIVMAASFSIAFGLILFQMLSGTGNTQIALGIELIVIVIYLLLTYILSYYNAPIAIVWSVEIFYGMALGIISLLFFKFKGTKGKLI